MSYIISVFSLCIIISSLFEAQVTANLVKQQIKVAGQFIHDLDMNRPHVIDGVEVTLLDANQ